MRKQNLFYTFAYTTTKKSNKYENLIFSSITIALLLSSCASEEITMPSNDSVPTKRSPEEAITIAQNLADRLQGTDNQSRSIRSTAKVSVIGSGNLSRASQDTLIYAIDFEDNHTISIGDGAE